MPTKESFGKTWEVWLKICLAIIPPFLILFTSAAISWANGIEKRLLEDEKYIAGSIVHDKTIDAIVEALPKRLEEISRELMVMNAQLIRLQTQHENEISDRRNVQK